MTTPKQHHYLPKSAYLSFFEIPAKPRFIYLYQRAKDIVLVSTHNVAKEKQFYSFMEKDGTYNTAIEDKFAKIESNTKPILEKLNETNDDFSITGKEKGTLFTFLSLLSVRTTAFRQQLKDFTALSNQMFMQAYAQRRETLKNLLEQAKKKDPSISLDDVTIEDLQEFILDDSRYKIVTSGDHFLGRQLEVQQKIFDAIWTKGISVLKVDSENFITSDHPVSLVKEPGIPQMFGGFLYSDNTHPNREEGLSCVNT